MLIDNMDNVTNWMESDPKEMCREDILLALSEAKTSAVDGVAVTCHVYDVPDSPLYNVWIKSMKQNDQYRIYAGFDISMSFNGKVTQLMKYKNVSDMDEENVIQIIEFCAKWVENFFAESPDKTTDKIGFKAALEQAKESFVWSESVSEMFDGPVRITRSVVPRSAASPVCSNKSQYNPTLNTCNGSPKSFAVGISGIPMEVFERWISYHPGASFELI